MNLQTACFGSLALWVLSASPSSALWHGWEADAIDQVPTKDGMFRIMQMGEGGYNLYLGDRLIRELGGFYVDVRDALPNRKNAQYLLIGIEEGGGSCPVRYRLLDVSRAGHPHLTESFGNCSESPTFLVQGPSAEIDFPVFDHAEPEAWQYDPSRQRLTQMSGDFYPPS